MATRDIYETAFDEDVQTDTESNQCPECDGRVTTNAVETVCGDCGLVIEEQRLDHGPEWRGFDEDERDRTGAPLTAARHDRGLSTEIGRGTDANGNELSGQERRRLARMRREQTRGRWRSKAERNLAHGLGEVRRLASALELSGPGVSALPERPERGSASWQIHRGHRRGQRLRGLPVQRPVAVSRRHQRDGPRRGVTGHSGNSAEAHPFRRRRKRVSHTIRATETASPILPTLLKNIFRE